MRTTAGSLAIALSLVVSLGSVAQVAPGDPIKVTAPALGLDASPGSLVAIRSDSLIYRPAGPDTESISVPVGSVTMFEVQRGGQTHGEGGKGAVIGAITGGLVGAVAASASSPSCQSGNEICAVSSGVTVSAGFFLGAAAGAVVGLLVGAAIRVPKFTLVYLPEVGTAGGIAPSAGRPRPATQISLAVRF